MLSALFQTLNSCVCVCVFVFNLEIFCYFLNLFSSGSFPEIENGFFFIVLTNVLVKRFTEIGSE